MVFGGDKGIYITSSLNVKTLSNLWFAFGSCSLTKLHNKVGLVKRYSRLSDKIGQIGDCAHYIAMVNSGSKKDFQIAEQTNKILKLVGEIQ